MNNLRITDPTGTVVLTGTIETGKARSARRVSITVAQLANVPGNVLEVQTHRGWERRWVHQIRRNSFYTRTYPE